MFGDLLFYQAYPRPGGKYRLPGAVVSGSGNNSAGPLVSVQAERPWEQSWSHVGVPKLSFCLAPDHVPPGASGTLGQWHPSAPAGCFVTLCRLTHPCW